MVTVRIDFKKIREEKALGYLDSWYCPLEMARKMELDATPDEKFSLIASSRFASSIILNKVPLRVSNKHVMAGF